MRAAVNRQRSRNRRTPENALDPRQRDLARRDIDVAFERYDVIRRCYPQSRKQRLRAPGEQAAAAMTVQAIRAKRQTALILRMRSEKIGLKIGKQPRFERTGGCQRELRWPVLRDDWLAAQKPEEPYPAGARYDYRARNLACQPVRRGSRRNRPVDRQEPALTLNLECGHPALFIGFELSIDAKIGCSQRLRPFGSDAWR